MSGSDSRDQFTMGFNKPQPQPQPQPQQQLQPHLQNMRLDYAADGAGVFKPAPMYNHSAPVTAHINGGDSAVGAVHQGLGLGQGNMGVSSAETPLKRKRGRPRKYGPDGSMALSLTTTTPPPAAAPPAAPAPACQPGGPGQLTPVTPSAPGSTGTVKKGRGRPRGSVNKNSSKSSGKSRNGFVAIVITANAGEDLSSKIMAVSRSGARHVCILAANGTISNVTLRQPDSSGGTVTYEGRFEILSLGGSLLLSENSGSDSRCGGLSVSLSGPDGRVLGGPVAGLLVAAAPVQIVLGSFGSAGRKGSKYAKRMENLSAPPTGSTAGQSSSPSRGTFSESSGGPGSPLNQSTGACNNNNTPQGIPGMPWK